jgi:hypothetical protein
MKKLRFDFAIDKSGKFDRDQLHQWLIGNPLVEDHVREMASTLLRPFRVSRPLDTSAYPPDLSFYVF